MKMKERDVTLPIASPRSMLLVTHEYDAESDWRVVRYPKLRHERVEQILNQSHSRLASNASKRTPSGDGDDFVLLVSGKHSPFIYFSPYLFSEQTQRTPLQNPHPSPPPQAMEGVIRDGVGYCQNR